MKKDFYFYEITGENNLGNCSVKSACFGFRGEPKVIASILILQFKR